MLHSDYLNGKFVKKLENDIVEKIVKAKHIVLQPRIEDINSEEGKISDSKIGVSK